jgi:hypothetical protein
MLRNLRKEAVEIKGHTTRLFTTVRVDDPELIQLLDQHNVQYSGRVESQWLQAILTIYAIHASIYLLPCAPSCMIEEISTGTLSRNP